MKSEINSKAIYKEHLGCRLFRAGHLSCLCYSVLVLCLLPLSSLPIYAIEVSLSVKNPEAVEKISEPITSGVPFAEGVLFDSVNIRLFHGNSSSIPVQCRPAAYWPDGSIRWLHINFQITLQPNETALLRLKTGVSPVIVENGIRSQETQDSVIIDTGVRRFSFSKKELKLNGSYFEVSSLASIYRAVPEETKWTIEESGPLKTTLKVEGNWYSGASILENNLVRFTARITFLKDKDELRLQLVFRNNNSFGWDAAQSGKAVSLTGARFISDLLAPNGSYIFGQGTEKTWNIRLDKTNTVAKFDSRYNSDGSIAQGYQPPGPLALASPEYYSSTRAWGIISRIKSGFESSMQQDFDRFEKLQRAKVDVNSLENPPGLTGITIWRHLNQDINSWCDYGDLTWGGDVGKFSGNHYDWSYGMFLQFFRSGFMPYLNAAMLLARHEIDFDIYHTNSDGKAFNFQKNWESRPSHESPGNDFGGGRPSHTWSQGYALLWLLTGDLRARDAFMEIQQGVKEYIYESFNENGYINTSEIRFNGWLTENLLNLHRIDPRARLETPYGQKTISGAMKDVLKNVLDKEAEAGKGGFVIFGDDPTARNLRSPLQNLYFLEPAIKAYSEVFKSSDKAYASELFSLIERMTNWIMSITYGGTTNSSGDYLPLQIPYWVDTNLAEQTEGQIPYLLMASNAAGFCYTETAKKEYLNYARKAFSDYVRYLGVVAGDTYLEDLTQRTAASYNSNIYVDSESKIHGWSSRYGQYYLESESTSTQVEEKETGKEIQYQLSQNYPNPFNPSTIISYKLPVQSNVSIKIFDVLGHEIETLVNGVKPAGSHIVEFSARKNNLPSGIYFYIIRAGNFSEIRKMTLTK